MGFPKWSDGTSEDGSGNDVYRLPRQLLIDCRLSCLEPFHPLIHLIHVATVNRHGYDRRSLGSLKMEECYIITSWLIIQLILH